MLRKIGPFFLPLAVACICVKPARAQYFTNHEGYTDAGQYRLQVELSPYLWLPAMSESFAFAHSAMDAHAAGSFGSPVPSLGTLAFSRQFSFMGDGVLRYGPYSTELDIQYVSASGSKPFSFANQLHVNTSYVRIAPGLGYQVYAGKALTIPVSVDARAGFSYFENWENLQGEGNLSGEAGRNDNFVQPWVGTRIDFVPGPRWRVELASIIQGMGIDSGSWGWGASGIISYALNDWVALNAGYSALNTERNGGNYDTPGAPKRSLELTAYGPVFGMTFRFGNSPPAPPPPTPVPVAAPAPASSQTYLVYFDWGKADLTPRAAQIIAEAAVDSKTQAVTTIRVNDYTGASGSISYNHGLSVRRAKVVAGQLVADGVPEAEIVVKGFGELHLLVPAEPGVREPQNSRVEIILQ